MDDTYDYRKFAVLYVDDEEKSLKSFARAFGETFRILTANNAQDGLKLLEQHKDEIGVLMTDQRMPGEKGVWLLEKARQLHPRGVRILATAYADMDAAIAAVNTGGIYKYVTKPWDPPQLEMTLKRALEFYQVQRERDQLLREKMSVLRNLLIADRIVSLGLLAAGLSHHIRNALVAVKTFLDLAPAKLAEEQLDLNSLRNPDFWKEYHQNVQTQIEKISNLLRELWAASEKPVAVFAEQVRVSEVVAGALDRLAAELAARNLTVETELPETLPALTADRAKLDRLFELLLKDELVSLPPGCRLRITARLVNGQAAERAHLEIQVADNGPGMPAEALRLIFDPFVPRSDSPAEYGIHLMACYFIVHHHGGKIEARSQPGQGTTFVICLPLHPERVVTRREELETLQKALLNEQLWEQLAASH